MILFHNQTNLSLEGKGVTKMSVERGAIAM